MLDKSSLFRYAVDTLGFSESVTYTFKQTLSVSKASRICSSLNPENATEWIHFASRHTSREIDQEVARKNPKAAKRDRYKPISKKQVATTMTLSCETFVKLEREQALRRPSPREQVRACNDPSKGLMDRCRGSGPGRSNTGFAQAALNTTTGQESTFAQVRAAGTRSTA